MPSEGGDYVTAAVESALAIIPLREQTKHHEQMRRATQIEVAALRQARDEAIWHMFHDLNMTALEIAKALRQALLDRGLTTSDIRRAGISHDTVRNITGSRRAPQPPPSQS